MLKYTENEVFRLLESRALICRFCLDKPNESAKMFSVFKNNIPHMLSFCCENVLLLKDTTLPSALPELICDNCYSSLQNSYTFLSKVNNSHTVLTKYLQSRDSVNNVDENCANSLDESTTCDTTGDDLFEPRKSEYPGKKRNKSVRTTRITKENTKRKKLGSVVHKVHDCPSCNKKYKSNFELKVHQRTHTGEKPFTCSSCGKTFTDSRNLRRHEKIHTGNKEHTCLFCKRKFLHSFSLKAHERIHNGEKPYICETCGKSFNTSGELTVHYRIHTKEKPYSCDICQKAFASKGTLNIHTRVHTGEKRHSCQLCPRKCRTASDLRVHMRCHNNEKPYHCKYANCEKRYKNSSQLNVHLRTHTGQKPHECIVCYKKFGESNTLKRHLLTH